MRQFTHSARVCQFPCSQNCETRNFFAHNMTELLIDSSPSQLESHMFICRPMGKLFGSSPIRLESQVSVCRLTLKLIYPSHSQLESSASIRQPSLKLFGSSPRRLSFDHRRTCWLTSRPSVLWLSQPLTTHVLDVYYPPVIETKMSPIVCTPQN